MPPRPSPPPIDTQAWSLAIIFTIVLGSFLATTVAIRRASSHIDIAANELVANATRGIDHLATIPSSALSAKGALAQYLDADAASRPARRAALDAGLAQVEGQVRAYVDLPAFAGERAHYAAVERTWARFDEAVRQARRLADAGHAGEAGALVDDGVDPALGGLVRAALDAIAFDADAGRALAAEISDTRRRATELEDLLTGGCILLGVAGAVLVHRQALARRALAAERLAEVEERAAELEQFAGRIAHDLRNPLSAAALSAELLQGSGQTQAVVDSAARIRRALGRAEALTAGLLEFARAGARPDPGARADVSEIIHDLIAGASPDAHRSGTQLELGAIAPVLVACSPGVYLSLVGNLVRNAVKYMGSSTTRRVTVDVVDGPLVRTEITDTGPGIPAELQQSLFEPYFRGAKTKSSVEGLGLGLATVKKLVEAHGGRVGVVSAPGAGSTFWFELPRAGRTEAVVATEDAEPRAPATRH